MAIDRLLMLSGLLLLGCAHGKATAQADARPRAEETALQDAFGELVGFVNSHPDLIDTPGVAICVVLGDIGDPSERTLAALRATYARVEPASRCPFKTEAVLVVAADSGEALDDGRQIAHAGFSLGQHNGMSWAYRLAPSAEGWKIDAKLESRSELP